MKIRKKDSIAVRSRIKLYQATLNDKKKSLMFHHLNIHTWSRINLQELKII